MKLIRTFAFHYIVRAGSRMSVLAAALFLTCATSLVAQSTAAAAPELSAVQQRPRLRAAAFQTPPELRPRVNFWLGIFTRYGKNQVVIHHREYPQATFAVLDFSKEAAEMHPVVLERFRKQRVAAVIKDVVTIIRSLAAGHVPNTDSERQVAEVMRIVPGRNKYGDIVANPELIRSQTGIKEKCGEALARSGQYLPEIERIFVREFGLPIELTRMPFIESSFDYRAYSSVGAAGIWQFMPRTGRQYLTINKVVDERRDPIIASYAAARYLQEAYESLGAWPLAVTSYNHGKAGVARKVRDFGTSDISRLIERAGDKPFGFASSNFYPEFLAALEVFENPRKFFPDVKIASPLEVVKVPLQSAMSISQIARKLNVSVADLQQVNLALHESVWSGRSIVPRGYTVKVPRRPSITVAKLSEPEIGPVETPAPVRAAYAAAYYRVKKGDTLSAIAKRYKTSISELQRLNDLSSGSLRIGQQLAIAESGTAREKEPKKDAPPSDRIKYIVKSGDSLHSIAARHGISVGQIREINKLASTKIKPGQQLTIEPKRSAKKK